MPRYVMNKTIYSQTKPLFGIVVFSVVLYRHNDVMPLKTLSASLALRLIHRPPMVPQPWGYLMFPLMLALKYCWKSSQIDGYLKLHDPLYRHCNMMGFTHTLVTDARNCYIPVGHLICYIVLFVFHCTARCRYNAVKFLRNPHNRHPIGRP